MIQLRAAIGDFLCYENWVMGFFFAGRILTIVNGLLSVLAMRQLVGIVC